MRIAMPANPAEPPVCALRMRTDGKEGLMANPMMETCGQLEVYRPPPRATLFESFHASEVAAIAGAALIVGLLFGFLVGRVSLITRDLRRIAWQNGGKD
ncbi:MAG: hypothetical protein FD180_2524 [Planctomycetota bacterium]|nr:MAG: hypothetical protein FD180_2524 [Planctomycetota bacterium]